MHDSGIDVTSHNIRTSVDYTPPLSTRYKAKAKFPAEASLLRLPMLLFTTDAIELHNHTCSA